MRKFLLKIYLKDFNVKLKILDEDKTEIDCLKWKEKNNLSLELLANIDKILKNNKIKLEQLNNIVVDSNQTTYSSTRIAKTVARAGSYCLTN